jgi:hypothetical protein
MPIRGRLPRLSSGDRGGSIRVLFSNNTLAYRAGSELYVRDVAIRLKRRGHHPVAYSTILGPVAEDLRAAGVPTIDDLRLLAAPIHRERCFSEIFIRRDFGRGSSFGYFTA